MKKKKHKLLNKTLWLWSPVIRRTRIIIFQDGCSCTRKSS